MSVLQVYLNWANSVLSDLGPQACDGVSSLQQGVALCQLIDRLCPDASLQNKVEDSGINNPEGYVRAALDHMRNNGIRFRFAPQDILDGDIKSILDVLWLIILNYGIHSIGQSTYQRSVGIGKKILLDWCQRQLQAQFDPQDTLTYNLCSSGDWFWKLLEKHSETPSADGDKEERLKYLLSAVENKFGIRKEIVSSSDVVEGTLDEHTLMIYISLLRTKVGDDSDETPVTKLSELQERVSRSRETSPLRDQTVPSIVLSRVEDTQRQSPSPPHHPDTSDWTSGSTGSFFSSSNDRSGLENRTINGDVSPEARSYIMATISQQVQDHISREPGDSPSPTSMAEGDREVKLITGEEEDFSPRDMQERPSVKKITVRVKRPRSPNSIMAEARLKQEVEKERKEREKVLSGGSGDRVTHVESDEPVMTGSASEGDRDIDWSSERVRRLKGEDREPVRSDDDDKETKEVGKSPRGDPNSSQSSVLSGLGQLGPGMPVFVVPGQSHDMALLLEALRHARTEASYQDLKMTESPEQTTLKQSVDENIELLETELMAAKEPVSSTSNPAGMETPKRGRPLSRDSPIERRGERRSPPRGILDVVANNMESDQDETLVKERTDSPASSRVTPTSILRNRNMRSPVVERERRSLGSEVPSDRDSPDRRRITSPSYRREGLSPESDRFGARSPGRNTEDEDADRRLIKFLTNEIENMKMKIEMLERGGKSSPASMIPRVSGGLPDRDRSPSQISSRARARYDDSSIGLRSSSYSPDRKSPERRAKFADTVTSPPRRSRSPQDRLGSAGSSPSRSPTRTRSRSPSQSPARSPVSSYRSRTPPAGSGRVPHPMSPSLRVLSLQDLSSSVTEDPDGKLNFSPARGSKIDLGYSSPIRKVTQEIWGNEVTDEDYYKDTAKYDKWKQLIALVDYTDDDVIEIKQALASAIVELDILQAKLHNANMDIKEKMGKTTDVLNDCRAHLTKSQAENMELRSQNEREKAKAQALELRMKEMEENLHSSKTKQDDTSQELEESVITLKGIIGQDKNTIRSLEDDNEKLREKVSTLQQDNIRLKEDFNELKIYNDKAQTTVKDLKTCLEDAKKERIQLVSEIKKLQTQGKSNQISSIMNRYIEKGLYEEQEKTEPEKPSRSRSLSPMGYRQQFETKRSVSPVATRRNLSPQPVKRSISPVLTKRSTSPPPRSRSPGPKYFPYNTSERAYSPLSKSNVGSSYMRPISPSPQRNQDYDFEAISPGVPSDDHEIYPHRRTRSYIKKFGQTQDGRTSPVYLDDPDLKELLKPRSVAKLDLDMDLSDNYTNWTNKQDSGVGDSYEIYEPVPLKPKMSQVDSNLNEHDPDTVPLVYKNKDIVESVVESPPKSSVRTYSSGDRYIVQPSQSKHRTEVDFENKQFIAALDNAVYEPVTVSKNYLDDLDLAEEIQPSGNRSEKFQRGYEIRDNDIARLGVSPARGRFPTRGILKSAKSEQNLSIKEGIKSQSGQDSVRNYSPATRAALSRSYSPGQRNSTGTLTSTDNFVSQPGDRISSDRYASQSADRMRRYGSQSSDRTRGANYGSQSADRDRYGSQSSGTSGREPYTGSSKSKGVVRNLQEDFSKDPGNPKSTTSRPSSRSSTPRSSTPRTKQWQKTESNSPMLTEDERRYADLLIDKYTRQCVSTS